MIDRLQEVIARLEQLPSATQEDLAQQINSLVEPYELIDATPRKSFAGVMPDLPNDFLDELDSLRHSVTFTSLDEHHMAQISISDESYQKIETLAQERKLTPEQLIDLALVQLEIAQERAEYGDAFIEELRQQANAPVQHLTFYGSTEDFLQSVHDAPYASSGDKADADL